MALLSLVLVPTLALVPGAAPAPSAHAVEASTPAEIENKPLLVVVDLSDSMSEDDGTGRVKLDGAKVALTSLVLDQPPGIPLGLWTYPGTSGSCSPGSLLEPVGPLEPENVAATIRGLTVNGKTPTGDALLAAADSLRSDGYAGATIVLVSDGESNCGPPPCEVAETLVAEGFNVSVQAIGFRTSDQGREELECVASATGGSYYDVEDGDELVEDLSDITRARLNIDLEFPEEIPAGASATVRVGVSNLAAVDAQDVQVALTFADAGPDSVFPAVVPPRYRLGNIPAGGTVNKEWVISSAGAKEDDVGEFTVTAWAVGAEPARAGGRIAVSASPPSLADGGELLRQVEEVDGTVVIMGDSYSSGEGTRRYTEDTDTETNRCHRSPLTYAAVYVDTNIACSGAVINDFYNPQGEEDQGPQLHSLKNLTPSPDLVFLTIGGNDVNFSGLVTACAVAPDCTRQLGLRDVINAPNMLLKMLLDWGATEYLSDGPVERAFVDIASTEPQLTLLYRRLDAVLNSKDAIASRDGREAAIVVLSYPQLFGHHDRASCRFFSRNEVKFFNEAGEALHKTVGRSVASASQQGANVYFANRVVDAMLPYNTVCSDDPYINPVEEILDTIVIDYFTHKELMHPNVDGYLAVTQKLLDSSHGFTPSEAPRKPVPEAPVVESSAPVTTVKLDDASAGEAPVRARQGDSIEVTAEGFAPGSTVTLTVHSTPRTLASLTADEEGVVSGVVYVPGDLPSGRHAFLAAGLNDELEWTAYGAPLEVSQPRPWWVLVVLVASGVCLVAGLTLIGVMRRRRAGDAHPAASRSHA